MPLFQSPCNYDDKKESVKYTVDWLQQAKMPLIAIKHYYSTQPSYQLPNSLYNSEAIWTRCPYLIERRFGLTVLPIRAVSLNIISLITKIASYVERTRGKCHTGTSIFNLRDFLRFDFSTFRSRTFSRSLSPSKRITRSLKWSFNESTFLLVVWWTCR